MKTALPYHENAQKNSFTLIVLSSVKQSFEVQFVAKLEKQKQSHHLKYYDFGKKHLLSNLSSMIFPLIAINKQTKTNQGWNRQPDWPAPYPAQ